jgi:hypothetical protein
LNEKGLSIHYARSRKCLVGSISAREEELPEQSRSNPGRDQETPLDMEDSTNLFPSESDDFEPLPEQNDAQDLFPNEEENSPSSPIPADVLTRTQHYSRYDEDQMPSTHTTDISTDHTQLHRYVQYITIQKDSVILPPTYRSDLELLSLLQKSNVPLSMYEQIQKWARKSFAINPSVFFTLKLIAKKSTSVDREKI